MRFLIFNLVVVGALVYLFTGGQLPIPEDANGVLHKVSVAAKNTVAAGRKATASVVEKVLPEPLAPIQAAPIEVLTQAAVPPIPVAQKLAAPKAPAIKQTNARTTNPNLIPPAIDDRAVRQRQAEVLATGPVASVKGQTAFMSPSQRRRELHALSEEMELLFASSRMN